MARKPKYKEGMVVHPSLGERVADVIIGIILLACMALAIIPMWHTLMAWRLCPMAIYSWHTTESYGNG